MAVSENRFSIRIIQCRIENQDFNLTCLCRISRGVLLFARSTSHWVMVRCSCYNSAVSGRHPIAEIRFLHDFITEVQMKKAGAVRARVNGIHFQRGSQPHRPHPLNTKYPVSWLSRHIGDPFADLSNSIKCDISHVLPPFLTISSL